MQHKLKDIARELGVSTATVSNTLNGRGRVSEATKTRVRSKVAELGYQPSLVGRALRTGRSGVLGLVLPDISNPLFPAIAQAIETAAARLGYGILIADSHGDADAQAQALQRMLARGADGLIVVPCRGTRVRQTERPLAIIDTASTPGNSVAADHRGGGRLAMQHLQDLGHRRIVLLGQSRRSSVQSDRLSGMRDALGVHTAAREVWLEDDPDIAALVGEGFTGLIATSDIHALSALTQIQRAGYSAPRDISIVGFDDLGFSALIAPALTTLAQNTAEIATHAVDHLVTRLKGNPAPPERIVPMRLIIRESTRPAQLNSTSPIIEETR